MAQPLYHHPGMVSVFLGCFPDEQAFAEYLKESYTDGDNATCPFWTDLGVNWLDHDLQDALYCGDRPVPVREFLRADISYIDSFRAPLEQQCLQAGITVVNGGVFLYDFVYSPSRPFTSSNIRFVGSFAFSGEHPQWLKELMEDG